MYVVIGFICLQLLYTLFTMFTMLYTLFAFRSVFSVCVYVCVGSGGVYVYMSACIAVFVCMCVCNDDVCVIWLYESLRGRHTQKLQKPLDSTVKI